MLDVKIDRQEQTDLFEQVAAEIRRAIADDEAKPGERLPPARGLFSRQGVEAMIACSTRAVSVSGSQAWMLTT